MLSYLSILFLSVYLPFDLCLFVIYLSYNLVNLSNATGYGCRTWVIGDSHVYWAGRSDAQLQGGGQVTWFGERGGHLCDAVGIVKAKLARFPYPQTIVIHIGTNDIFTYNTFVIRQRIVATLMGIRQLLPATRIVWSDVLPRLYYYKEENAGSGRRIANFMNAQAHKVVRSMTNAVYINHNAVLPVSNWGLFRLDGLHLSEAGLLVLRMSWSEALVYFNTRSGAVAFPP